MPRLITRRGSTKVNMVAAPGGHGDVGGHWMNNGTMPALTLHGMVKHAKDVGVPLQPSGITLDPAFVKHYQSKYVEYLVSQYAYDPFDSDRWKMMSEASKWSIMSEATYKTVVATPNELRWEPGPRFGQGYTPINIAKTAQTVSGVATAVGGSPAAPAGRWLTEKAGPKPQPWLDSYPRKIDWVTLQLSDLYDGIDDAWLKELAKRRLADDGDGGSELGGWEPAKPTKPKSSAPVIIVLPN